MKPSRSLFESLPSHISINSSFLYRLEHYIQKATLVNTSKIRSEPTVASILLEIVFHEPASFNPLRNYFRI
ncbi:MAG: hypothetical protein NZ576_08260 [Bacteroidia bacterium]|nr:hypothetical protein [Bacteroidia bacterium]